MGKKICIDAGHGGHDSGASGNGLLEKDLNLEYALLIGKELQSKGHAVIYTRTSDVFIALSNRADTSNNANCDLFLSVHFNDDEKKAGKGYEVLYNPTRGDSFAKYVDNVISKQKTVYQKRRGIVSRTDLTVLNRTRCNSCLVELGFMCNKKDMNLLTESKRKGLMARTVADAIDGFIKDHPTEADSTKVGGFDSDTDPTLGGYLVPGVAEEGLNSGLPPLYAIGGKPGSGGPNSNFTTSNPLVPFYKPTVIPPSYYNDKLPLHRDTQSKFFMRVGDCQFFIPPLFINVTDNTSVAPVPTIRQREGVKIGAGYSNRMVEMTIWFDGVEHINGIEMEGPCGQTYYMDGLRSLLAQFKKTPFLPIVNELLNDVHKIFAVTLMDATYQTVPEMPGCVQARLVFKEFNAQPYIGMPSICLDSLYCWPLFRWFYQQQLTDGDSFSKFKLPKIQTSELTGNIKFRLLPEDVLVGAEPVTNPENNADKRYSYLSHEWAFMEDVDMKYEDLIVNNITASVGQIVTDIQLAMAPSPTHQFMGSLETVFTISMTGKSREVCKQLSDLNQTVQGYSRKYKNKIVTGYLGIENEFINLFGVETVCVTGLSIRTMEGFQDEFEIVLNVISYNKTQKEQEKPEGMAPHNILDESDLLLGKTAKSYKTPMVIDGVIEDMIRDLELYPDLQLPTYHVVNDFITALNTDRRYKGLMDIGVTELISPYQRGPYGTSMFVDPDFYIFYPSPSELGILSSEDLETFYASYRSGPANGMLDKKLKWGHGKEFEDTIYQLLRDCKDLGRDFIVPASFATDAATQDIPGLEDKEYYKLMFHDMFAQSKRYTMCRAFPTALFLFVDEGRTVRGTRMWNNFYTYHSIIEASVYKDKDSPVNVCEMRLSNVYYSLSTKPTYTDAKRKNVFETFFLNIDDEMLKARRKMYEFMNIEAGCRIHVRMGYGSYASDLPVVFNGHIAEIDSSDIMAIIAQSDGSELLSPIPAVGEETTNGAFKYGKEPSTVMRNIMSERTSAFSAWNWVDNIDLSNAINNSKYGIEHFGSVYYKDSGEGLHLKALFHIGDQDRFSYDVTKNIYRGLPFVDSTGDLRRTTSDKYKWSAPFGEYNTYMYIYGKSPWDIFKVFAAANTEYIVGVDEHNFRSTLFFGQPTWLYKYGTEYVGASDETSRLDINNYNEKIKTYSQAHCIDSLVDIIDNGIMASSQAVVTGVIPVYTEGEDTKSDLMIYADRNIYPEDLKVEYYDTTSMQDYWLWEPMYTAMGVEPARDSARCMGISYLQHSFKNMYQGYLTILGDTSIKPYDVIFLNDAYRKMYGPCYVGSVTHSISIDAGFTTTIKPDLISTTHMSFSVTHGRMLSMANLFAFNVNIATSSLSCTTSYMKAFQMFKNNNLMTSDRGNNTDSWFSLGGAVALGAATLLTGGGALVVAMAAVIGWNVVDSFIEWYQKVFDGKDGHTIALMPLMLNDRPLLAGVKGHQTLVPGWIDRMTPAEMLADPSVDPEAFKEEIRYQIAQTNAVQTGVYSRQSTGVDIFNLDMKATEFTPEDLLVIGASDDKQLYVHSSNADALNDILYGGSYGSYASGNSSRNNIVSIANGKVGSDYVWGAEGQVGSNGKYRFDCSGFVYWVYNQAGIKVPRDTASGYWKTCSTKGQKLTYEALAPGDLIFLKNALGAIYHIQIYIGNGETIHAKSSKDGVVKEKAPTGSNVLYGRHPELMKTDSNQSTQSAGKINGKDYVHKFASAICTCYDDTDKTSTGKQLQANGVYCAAHGMPTGTKVYIPTLTHVNGSGIFIVEDTGGPFFDFDINTTKSIGKSAHDAYILSWGTGKVMYSFQDAINEQIKLGQWTGPKQNYYNAYAQWQGKFATEKYKHKG